MSLSEPKIYSDSYQLMLSLFNRTRAFPKFFRPTLGRQLEEAALDLLKKVRLAAVNKEGLRVSSLILASERLDEIRILLQISRDLKLLNIAGYGELSEITGEIGRQLGGFLRYEHRGEKNSVESYGANCEFQQSL